MDIKRTEVPGFPPGWYREESIRKSGLLAGKSDICYVRLALSSVFYILHYRSVSVGFLFLNCLI